jgi:hypothetical protein
MLKFAGKFELGVGALGLDAVVLDLSNSLKAGKERRVADGSMVDFEADAI